MSSRRRRRATSAEETEAPGKKPHVPLALGFDASTPHPGNALPSDVLQIIFSFIPLRARLLVLNQVCKKWRLAARQSVHTAPVTRDLPKFLDFPALTELDLRYPLSSDLVLPVTLRRLTIRNSVCGGEECGAACVTQLSSLTALNLPLTGCACQLRLLSCTGPTLTALSLNMGIHSSFLEQERTLSTVQLTRLTSLELKLAHLSLLLLPSALVLLRAVSSQLRSLRLHGFASDGEFHFPLLESHAIGGVAPGEPLENFLLRAPRLTELGLQTYLYELPRWRPHIAHLLTELDVRGFGQVDLSGLTKLRILKISDVQQVSPDFWAAHGHTLTYVSHFPTDLLGSFTSLTQLDVPDHASSFKPAFLPHLRILRLNNKLPFNAVLKVLRQVPALFPRLIHLSLKAALNGPYARRELSTLLEIFAVLERAGLQFVHMRTTNAGAVLLQERSWEMQKLRWLSVIYRDDIERIGFEG